MQHVREISGNFFFTRAAPEGILMLGQDNRSFLTDIRLAFWCERSFPSNVSQTSEVSDLRVYLDGKDISDAVAKAMIGALTKRPNAKEEYLTGMTSWIDMLEREAPIIGLKSEVISEQRSLAKTYARHSWDKLLARFKTAGFGYRGALHPLNYVFREVLIAPLSLRAALFPSAKPDENPLSAIVDPRLVISHGPCRLYPGKRDPVELQFEGNITISAQSIFNDSWEIEMREILSKLGFQVAEMSDKMLELKTRYEEFEKRATEFKAIADGIEASLKELSKF